MPQEPTRLNCVPQSRGTEEAVAMRWYMLRSLGVEPEGPTLLIGDNFRSLLSDGGDKEVNVSNSYWGSMPHWYSGLGAFKVYIIWDRKAQWDR